MRIVQFQIIPGKDYVTLYILMEDGRMFQLSHPEGWVSITLPEHPMGMPVNPLGPPPEDRRG